MNYQIVTTTDGQFIGTVFNLEAPLMLGGSLFTPTAIIPIGVGKVRLFNSSYAVDAVETKET